MSRVIPVINKRTPNVVPACFDSVLDYRKWLDAAKHEPPYAENWVCEDCTVSYQASMTMRGRCARPDINLLALETADEI